MLRSLKKLHLLFLYLGLLIVSLVLISLAQSSLLSEASLLRFDAVHYSFIAENGYNDFRTAFFPLFPKVWSLIGVSGIFMSMINALIYFGGYYYLDRTFNFSRKVFILGLLLPSVVFFLVPYTESFFFFSSVIALIGLKKMNLKYFYFGLLICAISRPSYTVFIPSLILTFWLLSAEKKIFIRFVLGGIGVLVLGTLIVGVIQYLDTGQWFTFFEAQALWGNTLQIPQLPLRSWSDGLIIRLDGVAFLIGLVAIGFSLKFILRRLQKKEIQISTYHLFSILFISGISMAVLLFRGGSLFSLNRFVFASPFMLLFLDYIYKQGFKFKPKHYLFAFLALEVYWLLFNSFVHIQTLLKFTAVSIVLVLVLALITSKRKSAMLDDLNKLFLTVFLLTFQLYLVVRYLNGDWVA